MKLDIKIDGLVGIFTTNKLVVEHTGEGIEIIELADQDTKVVNSPEVEMPKENKHEPKVVVQSVPVVSQNAACSIQEYLKQLRNDEMILAARKYCGGKVSDVQFSNILTAIELYGENMLPNVHKVDKYGRLQKLTCLSVFITAGVRYPVVRKWYKQNYPKITIPSTRSYSGLVYGTLGGGEELICKMLWPDYYRSSGYNGRRSIPTEKLQQILDAILAGYTDSKIAKYYDVSGSVVCRIRMHTHSASGELDYRGVDTSNCAITVYPVRDVRICKRCGKVIPVKQLLTTPKAECCAECQKD